MASDRPRWPHPTLRLFGRAVPAFRLFGAAGFAAGVVAGLAVAPSRGVGAGTVAAMFVLAVLTYLSLAALAMVVAGEPVLVFYHHAVGVAVVLAAASAWLGWPVLSHLDVYAVSLMAFLAVARLGCLTVGCCHGAPHDPRTPLGAVVYGDAHADDGFPRHLVGVPLFPLQAVEATGAALLAIGSVAVAAVADPPPGDLIGFVVVGYALLRYRLEGLRGDPGRAELRRLTEARITSVTLAVAVTAGAAAGLLPWHSYYPLAAVVLVAAAGHRAVATPEPWDLDALLHPDHVAEMAGLLALADDQTTGERIAVAETRAGLRLSTTTLASDDESAQRTVVTLSSGRDEPLPELAAFALCRLLTTMRQPEGGASLHAGGSGVFHVVLVDLTRLRGTAAGSSRVAV